MTPEDKLLHRFAQGSEPAFAELMKQRYNFVYSVCRRKLGDPVLAEDVTQAVFLILAGKASKMRPGTALTGWLFTTAQLACRNALRTEARRRHYERMAVKEMELTEAGPEKLWEQTEPRLDDALERLSGSDRDALLLRYVDGMSVPEIAVALGLSTEATHKRVSRAMDRLRKHLVGGGVALSAAALAVILDQKMVEAAPVGPGHGLSAVAGGSAQTICDGVIKEISQSRVKCLVKNVVLAAAVGTAVYNIPYLYSRPYPITRHTAFVSPATGNAHLVTLAGRVTDNAGNPVASARVTLIQSSDGAGAFPALLGTAKSDNDGLYSVNAEVSPGTTVAIADDGRRLGFGATGHDTMLQPSSSVNLHVVDLSGRPIARTALKPAFFELPMGANVEYVPIPVGCPARLIVTTDDQGNAALSGVPKDCALQLEPVDSNYALAAEGTKGYITVPATPSKLSEQITLETAATIKGMVTADGEPVSGVRVEAQSYGGARGSMSYTDAQGNYTLTQVLPDVYNVAVDETSPVLGGQYTSRAIPDLTVKTGQLIQGCNLTLMSGSMITGRVTYRGSGAPASGLQVGVYGPAHPQTSAWVEADVTDSHGAFHLRVPAGRQFVYVMRQTDAANGVNVDVRDGSSAVVNLTATPS